MKGSHLQTRVLTDALDAVDAHLAKLGTKLARSKDRESLARCFSPDIDSRYFDSWAYRVAEYDQMLDAVKERAPDLVEHLVPPKTPDDFTVVGHSSLELCFKGDSTNAREIDHELRDGTRVQGALLADVFTCYANGLVEAPTELRDSGPRTKPSDDRVYFYQPTEPVDRNAAELAATVHAARGEGERERMRLIFPAARTNRLPDYGWVTKLESTDGLCKVDNFVSSGEAIVDHTGFFARETHVLQYVILLGPSDAPVKEIDGPFLVFFADDSGVHAAAWFDRDSFHLLP